MKHYLIILLFLTSCGIPNMDIPEMNLSLRQPRVLDFEPQPGLVNEIPNIKLTFSETILESSLSKQSVCINGFEEEPDPQDLTDDIQENEILCINGTYNIDPENNEISFQPTTTFGKGQYGILITDKLLSNEGFPFNQNPGQSFSPFWSTFTVDFEQNDSTDQANNSDNVNNENNSDEPDLPIIPPPEVLMINEILYDVTGSDTDGDLFIELYGSANGNISNYKIELINGDNGAIYDSITIPENTTIPEDELFIIADKMTGGSASRILGADLIDNFDPQNGADSVQLVDGEGHLVDVLGYGELQAATAENNLQTYETLPAIDVSSDQSLSRINGLDTNDNSIDFQPQEPTPGML